MRLLIPLLLLLGPLLVPAAKQPKSDRFQDYHTRALSASPLKLADASYDRLTSSPRDYSVVVLLTALDARFGCQLCREFQPEWDLLARSWTKGDVAGESKLVYGTLDFDEGKNTFQAVCWHCAIWAV
jgi:oligosaccharyltransferase complex subunit gamma